jgi:hypothetical protein
VPWIETFDTTRSRSFLLIMRFYGSDPRGNRPEPLSFDAWLG